LPYSWHKKPKDYKMDRLRFAVIQKMTVKEKEIAHLKGFMNLMSVSQFFKNK
jgi:hypothetical protein